MAVPKLIEAKTIGGNSIALMFDKPLDESVKIPITSFAVNYGQSALISAVYSSSAIITLTVDDTFNSFDRLTITYDPPLTLSEALRGSIRAPVTDTKIKRCAVRSFSQYRVENVIEADEAGLGWTEDTGLSNVYGPGASCEPSTGSLGGAANGTNTNGKTPTPDDFILAYGFKETIQLSNLDNPSSTSVNTDRVWVAIQDACALIDSYIAQMPRSNKLIVSSSRRRVALIFARYYLDSVRRRQDVTDDYERAIKELDAAMAAPYVAPEPSCDNPGNLPARLNGGILKSWRIPQYYNGVSGKGLSGWFTDSAADEDDDWRTDNSGGDEANNDQPNYSRGGGGVVRNPEQPADGGGSTTANSPNP